MRFGKTIKKIAAIGFSTAMLMGSTIAVADLADYPSQYFTDGKFNGILVIGDKAAAEDVVGVTDIAVSLQYSATSPVGTATTDVSISGEAWKVGTSTNKLEMSENLDTGITNRETIADITSSSYISDAEMPNTLADGTVTNAKGDSSYNQRLYFNDTATGYVLYDENSDTDVTADFLYFDGGQTIAKYELEFTTSLESDVDDSSGSADTTGTYLTDIEDAEIQILGKTYTVVQARRLSSAGNNLKLILMGGSVKDTLLEGDTKTYSVGDNEYEVTLDFVSSTQAKFTVNGETTRLLRDGETDKLSDGTEIGVSEILYQDYAGGVHSSTFFIGASKMELKDSNIKDSASSNELKVADNTIDGANVILEGTDDNSTFKLDKISINMVADDDYYVGAGESLSENSELSEPEVLFTNNWDIQYLGLSTVAEEEIKIKPSGSSKYQLEFVDGSGDKATLPLLKVDSGSTIQWGDEDNSLIVTENKTINKDDYFIIVNENEQDGERSSYALRYRGADKITADNPVLKFDNLGSGERIERPISASGNPVDNFATKVGEIKLGGNTFNVYNTTSTASKDFNIVVDLDADGSLTTQTVALNTKYGARIDIINQSLASAMIINISTVNSNQYDNKKANSIVMNLTGSSGEGSMAHAAGDILNWKSPEGEDNVEYTYTAQGAKAKFDNPSSDPGTLTVWYPEEQRVPLVYVVGKGSSLTKTETVEGEAVTVNRIEVGATKLASEVADIKAQNAILVGGPCANAATNIIMGNPADCAAGFVSGKGMIRLYENDGKVAMVVAGYSAKDTRVAASIVANYKDNELKGTNMEVTTATSTVTEAVEAPVEEPATDDAAAADDTASDAAADDTTTDETA